MVEDIAQVGFVITVITVVLLLMVLLLVNLMLNARNKKLKHQAELNQVEWQFRENMARVQMEVAEATLGDVSRDLHDEVGQLLTFSILQLEHLHAKPDGNQQQMIGEVKQSVRDAMEAIRSISRGLNPDYVNQQGLITSIEQLLDRARERTGVKTALLVSKDFSLANPTHAIVIFRILRECLTNALKHGHATRITINLTSSPNTVEVLFSDNGMGINETAGSASSMGMKNMHHYASMVKGHIRVNGGPEKGTEIFLTIPNKKLN